MAGPARGRQGAHPGDDPSGGKVGAGLTKLQESQALARRKEIYEALHPETKRGAVNQHTKGKVLSDKVSFSEDTAAKTGKSKRTIERAVGVVGKIDPGVQATIATRQRARTYCVCPAAP